MVWRRGETARVPVTGSQGLIGSVIATELETARHEPVGCDLVEGQDILHLATLEDAVRGCDAVVHTAALLGQPHEAPAHIMKVNLEGTWNVLEAAEQAGVRRIVHLSSVDALGVFKGERPPDYLPLDNDHP